MMYEQQYCNVFKNCRYSIYNPSHCFEKRKIILQDCPCLVVGTIGQAGSRSECGCHTQSQVQSCLIVIIFGGEVRSEMKVGFKQTSEMFKVKDGVGSLGQEEHNSGVGKSPHLQIMVKAHASTQQLRERESKSKYGKFSL